MIEPRRVPTDEGWEVDYPAFRVQVWTQNGPDQTSGIMPSQSLEEFQFDGATLEEVFDWAATKEGPRTQTTVYAFIPEGDLGPGMIRLRGKNPTVSD